ncbi:O-antigen ligase family protein [Mobilicoccus massiliensis]|uniref:O-antigen ligase family protein n=1 Tax=Mobilicoccus massiliensis TaxID=1522310 RepID=UPI00058E207B|nr:O-antigen ligase family protein [Mobilicoccus massiliensis]
MEMARRCRDLAAGARGRGRPIGRSLSGLVTCFRLQRAADVLLVALGVYSVWLPIMGRLVHPYVTTGFRVTLLALGILLLARSPRRGALPAVLLVAMLLTWWATTPQWSEWAPRSSFVHLRQRIVVANILTTAACLLLAGGRWSGARAIRRMWVGIVVTTVPVGVWEVLTHRHLVASEFWRAPPLSPAATFGNPNNFAIVLSVGFGLSLVAATERLSRLHRVAWLTLAATCLGLTWLTFSRAALLACVVGAVVAAGLWLHRRRLRPLSVARRRPWFAAGLGLGAAALVVAHATIPAVAAANPVYRLIAPGDEVTARSDSLRIELVRIGLRYWRESPWFGIGTGRYQILLEKQSPKTPVLSMHNGLAEMLVEYGLVVAVPLAALLALLTWRAVVPRSSRRRTDGLESPLRSSHSRRGVRATDATTFGRPARLDLVGARASATIYLLGFVTAGGVVSSSVPWTVWWLLLASAAATLWWVGSESRPVTAPPEHVHGEPVEIPRDILDALDRQAVAAATARDAATREAERASLR